MFCTNCGAPIESGNAFCTACGAPVAPVVSSAAPADPVIPPAAPSVPPAYETPAVVTAPEPEASVSDSEPAPTTAHLKINMPGMEPSAVVTPHVPKAESPAAASFFSAAGSLGAEASDAVRPTAAPAVPASGGSHTAATIAAPSVSPSAPAVPSYPAGPAASAYPSAPVVPETFDSGGFRDSEPAAPAAPVVNYTVNPYDRYPESELYAEPPKRKRKIWPLVLVIVIAALIAAAAAAWFLIPGVKDAILGKPELSFKEESVTLKVGEKTDLNEILVFDHVDENKVRWESGDEEHSIIKCRDGKITAIGAGSCEVEVFLAANEDVSATIEIVVVDPDAPSDKDSSEAADGDSADSEAESSDEN